MTLPIPELLIKRLKATEQNPLYHGEGNVYNHTLMVLEQYHNQVSQYDLSEADREVLYWAAVLHDVGKPEVTKWEAGRWRSHGHEEAGVPIARDILLTKGLPSRQRRRILDLVRWHHIPFRWGRKHEPISAYKLLATQTNLRLLGIFALMDMMGRICECKDNALGFVHRFINVTVPQIEQEMGSFSQIQQSFATGDYTKKNALWTTWKQGEVALMEHILKMNVFTDNFIGSTCVMTIGAPRSGKTQHVKNRYPDFTWIDTGNSRFSSLQKKLVKELRAGTPLVLDGTHIDDHLRGQITQVIRDVKGTLHYVFFEKSLDFILQQNRVSPSALDSQLLIQAHKQLKYPHPWEAHSIEII